MKTLQKLFEQEWRNLLKIETIGTELIKKRLREIGIELTEEQTTKIRSQLSQLSGDVFHFELEDEQVFKAGFTSEPQARVAMDSLFENFASDIESFVDDFFQNIPSKILGVAEALSEQFLQNLKSEAQEKLSAHKVERIEFESNLYELWGQAFDLLEVFINISLEAGSSFNDEFRKNLSNSEVDFVFEVLTRLHARACQIAFEILTLLKAGLADGAHARWRSLHEVSVTTLFIKEHGSELAERYLLHDGIESYKAARIYQTHCSKLGYEPLTEAEQKEMETIHDSLIKQFGKSYKNDYGWASKLLGKDRPTFRDIEESVGLEYLGPYYKMACHNVHANPRGIFFKLGLNPESGDILLAGPSNVGHADPGQLTALSLLQANTALLLYGEGNLDRIVACRILMKLEDEIKEAFFKAMRRLDEMHA